MLGELPVVRTLRMRAAKHPLATLVAVFLLALCTSAVLLWGVGGGSVPPQEALLDVFALFLGEVVSSTSMPLYRIVITLMGLLASIVFLAIVTALIVNRFVKLLLRGGRVVNRIKWRDHVVVCGWNAQGASIVDELLSADGDQHVAILAELDRRPIEDERVEFLMGSPLQEADLGRASVHTASSAIVLTNFAEDPNEADARALMIVLAIESQNREVHTCVQVLNASNRKHFERVFADEIICLEQLGGSLAVASALNRGTSHLVSELLTFNSGSEIYRYAEGLPDYFIGLEFADAARALAEKRMILLGIETDAAEEIQGVHSSDVVHPLALSRENRIVILNPQGTYQLKQRDALFLIAESSPAKL